MRPFMFLCPNTRYIVRGQAEDAAPGDWVSIHWGWVCEVLDDRQRRNLERYTRYHLAIANQTI